MLDRDMDLASEEHWVYSQAASFADVPITNKANSITNPCSLSNEQSLYKMPFTAPII